MATDLVIPASALSKLAEAIAGIFVRRTVSYENNWNPSVDPRGQILVRAGSKVARRVSVEPINIRSAKLQNSSSGRAVSHGEELLVNVEQDNRVVGIPIYWVKWSEGVGKKFKSQVRVIHPPQFF